MTSDYLTPTWRVTTCAGLSQLINWGISFYMPGTFAHAIILTTGWSPSFLYGGLTLAMLIMAAISPFTARLLPLLGGQRLVLTGTLLIACGCFMLSLSTTKIIWMTGWSVIGIGMRLSLYDALFAVLVDLYGPAARRVISQVALFGGLASVVFWPLGTLLLEWVSWHTALFIYGCAGLLNAGLLWAIPNRQSPRKIQAYPASLDTSARLPAILYALFIALMTFVSNGTSTHLPELIANFGLPVTVGMLWGVGQTGARLLDVLSGQRLTPARLAVITSLLIPLCFLLALTAKVAPAAIAGFALGYGAVNGLMTVVKATLPLQLFNPEQYAERTGLLLIPGQLLAAVSPFAWAWMGSHAGIEGTLWISLSLGLAIAMLALALAKCVRSRREFSELLSSNP